MADNITVAGKTIATDEVTIGSTSVHTQRVKTGFGVDGSWTETSSTNPLPVADDAKATGGATSHHKVAAASVNSTNVKSSAGTVYGATITSRAATPVYLKFYNDASAPTVGTDTPIMVLGCPATDAKSFQFPKGVNFGTGISYGMTDDGPLDADTDVMTADEVVISIQYN